MVNTPNGARGPHVPLLVEEEHNYENGPVQIHLHNLGGKNALTNRNNRKFAIQTTAQWMVNILNGMRGPHVLLHVEEEHNRGNELVQIHLHNLGGRSAPTNRNKQKIAIQTTAQ